MDLHVLWDTDMFNHVFYTLPVNFWSVFYTHLATTLGRILYLQDIEQVVSLFTDVNLSASVKLGRFSLLPMYKYRCYYPIISIVTKELEVSTSRSID